MSEDAEPTDAYPAMFYLPDGSVLSNVHAQTECLGRACAIHAPSPGPLRDAPLHFAETDTGLVAYRSCSHWTGGIVGLHLDADDRAWRTRGVTKCVGWRDRALTLCCLEACCGGVCEA